VGLEEPDGFVRFEPFVGVGPRKYFDLFSMKLSNGYEIIRNIDGKIINWDEKKENSILRLQLVPYSYQEFEELQIRRLANLVRGKDESQET